MQIQSTMLSIQILFGLGLPLLLLTRIDGISSKGLLTVALHYIAFHSLKVSVYITIVKVCNGFIADFSVHLIVHALTQLCISYVFSALLFLSHTCSCWSVYLELPSIDDTSWFGLYLVQGFYMRGRSRPPQMFVWS